MEGMKNAYRILVEKPDGKRPFRKPVVSNIQPYSMCSIITRAV
jgi:hypothetical protein